MLSPASSDRRRFSALILVFATKPPHFPFDEVLDGDPDRAAR